MRVSKFLLVSVICTVVFSGCGNNNANPDEALETQEANKSVSSNEQAIEITNEIEEKKDIISEAEPDAQKEEEENILKEEHEPEILKFVDVFGEEYEVEINENIEKNPYSNEAFSREGDFLSYEDDSYISRMGIDISRHQGYIDWEQVKKAGIDFAFIRIGYRGYGKAGTINLDQEFDRNIVNAQKNGIDVGVYFFAQAINEDEALEEAQFVIKHLQDYELELPVVYDPESILDDVARTDNVTGEQFTKNTQVFCKTIAEAGYQPMIYSNMLWEAFELDLEELSEYPIWYADYEPNPQTPYMFEFWQYSNEGYIAGVQGRLDMDIQMVKK